MVTATPSPEEERNRSIVATMDAYETVIRDGSAVPIDDITDSAPIRRFLKSAAAVAPPFDGPTHRRYRVQTTTVTFPGVVEVELTRNDGSSVLLLFRERSGSWVLTEPTEAELGERHTISHGAMTIDSYAGYPHTDEVVATIKEAAATVQSFFGALPTQPLRIVLKPAFGVGATIPFDVQAFYTHGARPQITLTVPWAVNFRQYETTAGWRLAVQALVAHELVHYVHQSHPSFTNVNKAPSWVAEGLAEYVAVPLRLDQARRISRQNQWLPLDSPDGPSLLALDRLGPKERTVAYIQSQLLVAYLAHQDSADLWRFIDAYAEAPGTGVERLDRALQASRGETSTSFVREWRAWVETQIQAVPTR